MSLSELMDLDVESVSSFGPAPIAHAASDVVVITRSDIEASGARSLADILRAIPGFDITLENNGVMRAAVRGLDSPPAILLLVDGVRLNDPLDGAARYDFSASLIQRVEVVRGGGSTVYGSNANLAVVRVTTRTPDMMNLAIATGSLHTSEGLLTQQDSFGAWDFRAGISYRRSGGGAFVIDRDLMTFRQPDISEAPGRLGGAYERHNAHISLTRGPVEVGAVARDEVRAPYTGELSAFVREGQYRNRFVGAYARIDHPLSSSLRLMGDVQVSRWFVDDKMVLFPPGWRSFGEVTDMDNDGLNEVFPDGLIEKERYRASAAGLTTQLSWEPVSGMQLVGGFEARRTWVGDTYFAANHEARLLRVELRDWNKRQFPEIGRLFVAPYLQWEHNLGTKLRVVGGGRFDFYDDFGSAFSPRATAIFTPSDATWLQAIYARAFRAPTLRELHDPNIRAFGNPDLAAETVQSVQLKATHVIAEGVQVQATAYGFQINDRIDVGQTSSDAGRNPYFNLEGTRSVGGELELRLRVSDRYRGIASGAYHHTTDLATDTKLARIAPWSANLTTEAKVWKYLLLTGSLSYRGRREPPRLTWIQESQLASTGQPWTLLADLGLRTAGLPDGWWLRGSARNITGASYREIPRDSIYHLDEIGGDAAVPTQPRLFLVELGKEF